MQEREEREQGIENLFEKIVTENIPNLVSEIDTEVQEAEHPKQDEPKRPTTRHILLLKCCKLKTRENCKGSKRKAISYPQVSSCKTAQLIPQQKLCRPEGIGEKYLNILFL